MVYIYFPESQRVLRPMPIWASMLPAMLASFIWVSVLVCAAELCFFGPRQTRRINSIDPSLDASCLF